MYIPTMYDAYPMALFANLKDPLGKVGKLGTHGSRVGHGRKLGSNGASTMFVF